MSTQFAEIRLESLLIQAREMGAADIHLQAGSPPLFRVSGDLKARQNIGVGVEALQSLLGQMLDSHQRPLFEKRGKLRWVHWGPAGQRVRCLASKWSSGLSLTLRLLRDSPPKLSELGWDSRLSNLLGDSGLVLLTGQSGSGVSTTLASLVDTLNFTTRQHILCLEHDLETLHPYKLSMVNQRCAGRDFDCWKQAVRQAGRQEVDVLVLHDAPLATVWQEINEYLEGGGLALVTSKSASIDRMLEDLPHYYPPAEQRWVKSQLALHLRGVTHQRLVRGKRGLHLAGAVLSVSPGIRNLLLEGKLHQLFAAMSSYQQCQTLEQSLCRLVLEGAVTPQQAIGATDFPEELKRMLGEGAS